MDFPPLPQEPLKKLTLQGGRTLAYMEYGDPNGIPLLFFHGTPGTHHLIKLAEPGAMRQGFRLIAPDRPGLGDSTLQQGRELYHYPLDIVQLLEALQLDRVGIAAISGGVPYAFQCAHDIPERVKYVASLSGWVSYGREGMKEIPIERSFRLIGWAHHKCKPLEKLLSYLTYHAVQNGLDQLEKHLQKNLPPADIEAMRNEHNRHIFFADLQNAFKQGGDGVRIDSGLQFATPAYGFESIRQPVLLLHGTADTVVPFAFAEYMQKRLPNVAGFLRIENGGHLCAVTEQDTIFTMLKALE